MTRSATLASIVCCFLVLCDSAVNAQPPGRQGGRRGAEQQGGRGPGRGPIGGRGNQDQANRPGSQSRAEDPIMVLLDTNKDGQLSDSEIKNAVASLLKQDKNKNGQLDTHELQTASGQRGPTGARGQRGSGRAAGQGSGAMGPGRDQAGGRGGPANGGRSQAGNRGQAGGRGAGGGGGGRRGNSAQSDATFAAQIITLDTNGDGLITQSEIPEHMHNAFEIADADHSETLNKDELLVLAAQFRRNKLNPEGDQQMKNAPTQGRRPR